jgi:23S rRNA pseudouridine2604 synthase
MCEYFGYNVMSLTRVRIMHIKLGNLPVGHWRYFTPGEVMEMEKLLASSNKTYTPPQAAKKPQRAKPETKQTVKPVATNETRVPKKKASYKEFRQRGKK